MSGFEVLKSGVFTLIEDMGRFSYTHLGVTNSGFMDEYAALKANKLLENDSTTNLLEISFGNVKLKALEDTLVCLTGAKCEFSINGTKHDTWQTFQIKKNDEIEIGKILEGQRVYLAIKNGFNIKKEFGSFSTTIKENLGGLNGTQLKKGDFLPFSKCSNDFHRRLKEEFIPNYNEQLTLRVILSYQDDSFSKEEKEKFFSSEYKITPDFNRMACKLSGEKINSKLDGIVSEGIAYGAIQIPKDGQPIILLKERQTIGGYPKIGSVLSIDCFKLSQMKVGTTVKFEEISISQAQKKLKIFYNSLL